MNININLPDTFYDEETRCGYTISRTMKKVWAIELDLLNELDKICKNNNIEYYIFFGSLLGTIRHKGFIPWDDDIDVVMTRDNYNRLLALPSSLFCYPYFLQNEYTDPGCHIALSKFRNSDTAVVLDFEEPYRYTYNQGIFLDIFPLDNAPDDPAELQRHINRVKRWKQGALIWSRRFNSSRIFFNNSVLYITAPLIYFLKMIIRAFRIPNIPHTIFEKELQRYNAVETKNLIMLSVGNFAPFPRNALSGTINMPFEMLEVPVPTGYETVLNCLYGNWKIFVKGTSCHEGATYYPDKPYKRILPQFK